MNFFFWETHNEKFNAYIKWFVFTSFFFNEKNGFFLIIKVMSQFLIKLRYYLFMKHTP